MPVSIIILVGAGSTISVTSGLAKSHHKPVSPLVSGIDSSTVATSSIIVSSVNSLSVNCIKIG